MKKFILLGVSIGLIIACLLVGNSSKISVGPGMGIKHKVKNIEELANVLEFLVEQNEDNATSSLMLNTPTQDITLLSDNGENMSVKQLASSKSKKYTSATLSIASNASVSSSNEYGSAYTSLNREMTVFVTKKATLYQSKGVMTVVFIILTIPI